MLHALASGNYTRPDNIFISSSLMDTAIYCKTLPEECPARSDHIPVVMHLDVGFSTQTEPPWPNFKAADWKELRKVLLVRLEGLEAQDSIPNNVLFLSCVDMLMHVITEMIDTCILKCRPAP